MNMPPEHTGQIVTILLIAIALGMDALSICMGIGLRGIRLVHILQTSAIIGLFHMSMPLIGLWLGSLLGGLLGQVAVITGGVLLILLGGQMIYQTLRGHVTRTIHITSLLGVMTFAGSVSVDALSVGVTLGLFATDLLWTILLFGLVGGMMSLIGLLIGRRMGQIVGEYGEILGGLILLIFGVLFLFS
jgi:putative Mn2+ efflux pump MntP